MKSARREKSIDGGKGLVIEELVAWSQDRLAQWTNRWAPEARH